MATDATDAPLLDQQPSTVASHEEAFREVLAHWAMLNAYLRGIVRNPQLFEDTLSDVALAIARSWPTFDRTRPFGPWARAIARRTALENLGRHGIKPILLGKTALEALGEELDALGDSLAVETRVGALERRAGGVPSLAPASAPSACARRNCRKAAASWSASATSRTAATRRSRRASTGRSTRSTSRSTASTRRFRIASTAGWRS